MVAFVIGIFRTREAADSAARGLASVGFEQDEIGALPPSSSASGEGSPPWAAEADEAMAAEGALLGVAVGSVMGSLVGALVGAGIAGELTGAGAGGAVGGYLGALFGAGISREPEQSLGSGILLAVRADLSRREKAQKVLLDCGAVTIRQEILT
ncbi:MAG: hypothetical protein ABIP39_14945 [Polyangiaceae bacterium]